MEDLKINITETQLDGKELIVKSGHAKNIYDPEKVRLKGIISAPGDFIDKRKGTINKDKTHVVADYTRKTLTLTVEEDSRFAYEITGWLEEYSELEELKVNKVRYYSQKELYNALKMEGIFFKTKEAHTALMEKLKKFEGTVEAAFSNADNYKGSQAYKKVVEIKTNIDLEFNLKMPIFAGGKAYEFKVDINVDLKNSEVQFWLESVELHELMLKAVEEEFKAQFIRFADYVIIEKY